MKGHAWTEGGILARIYLSNRKKQGCASKKKVSACVFLKMKGQMKKEKEAKVRSHVVCNRGWVPCTAQGIFKRGVVKIGWGVSSTDKIALVSDRDKPKQEGTQKRFFVRAGVRGHQRKKKKKTTFSEPAAWPKGER